MMYLLFREKNIMPSQFYFCSPAEKRIVKVFFKQELEDRAEEAKRLSK